MTRPVSNRQPFADSSVDPALARDLRLRLKRWYRASRRAMPWRETKDPYAIWISEAMLQQTRVETVIPYWTRFMVLFPTIEALANTAEEEVLAAWSGLGYYRRARSLRSAAQRIVQEHAGEFPRDREELLALPGIGEYTAGAVLSIAFDQAQALVDGNVERVFARLFRLELARSSAVLKARCWQIARELVPARGAGDWNQALMELGATLCTPQQPQCSSCPVAKLCEGRAKGCADSLPLPAPKKQVVEVTLEILVWRRKDELLVQQRPAGGRMASMWQFPTRQLAARGPFLPNAPLFPEEWPFEPDPGQRRSPAHDLGSLRHAITHHRIQARVLESQVSARQRIELPAEFRWQSFEQIEALPLTGMAKKVLAMLRSE
ncbi:MAG: A/G-specific adenine glycosylase [Planctomycetota bacterium]|jgi:A/G-specific adenine glycosylase